MKPEKRCDFENFHFHRAKTSRLDGEVVLFGARQQNWFLLKSCAAICMWPRPERCSSICLERHALFCALPKSNECRRRRRRGLYSTRSARTFSCSQFYTNYSKSQVNISSAVLAFSSTEHGNQYLRFVSLIADKHIPT